MTHGLLDWMDRGPALLPWRFDRAVDRVVAGDIENYEAGVVEEMEWAIVVSARCKGCGIQANRWGQRHLQGCDIDTSLTASQRWQARNPDRVRIYHARSLRMRRIRARWAGLNGRCVRCVTAPAAADRLYCERCLATWRVAKATQRSAA